ncbi:hypothetical protein [Flavobacterium branchiicola]|uniref:Uncharacterized protein n=1 Tax=Flavobacterium branchiicola TaxID=1114875 RepID=A0ABV9PLJ0_9FLAO|nr:hypothetical protein [Flavobacterium branchiicola]MBS7256359.1 hypothetical protein [Flavobacterium branchiicola]
MKKNLIRTLTLLSVFLSMSSRAQISEKVTRNFPAHIVYQVYDVVSIVNISDEKQLKIAENFKKIDSIANNRLVNGEPVEQFKPYYAVTKSFLSSILSTEELNRFEYQKDKDNRFLTALAFSKELKLEKDQISKIQKVTDSIYYQPKKSPKETIQFYNQKLNSILVKEQYLALMRQIYKEQAMEDAAADWDRIVKLKINTSGKEKEELRAIANYELNKNSILDKKADLYTKKEKDLLAKKVALMEPSLLIRANILSDGNYAENKYSSVLQYESQLRLSAAQIDSLVLNYVTFEKVKIENKANKANTKPIKKAAPEYDKIAQILNSEQVNKWLINKNTKEGIKKAYESWEALEEENLTADLDKSKIIEEFSVYHLRYLVTYERAKIYKTQENIFSKRDIEQNKPDLLKQLDFIKNNKSKKSKAANALAW